MPAISMTHDVTNNNCEFLNQSQHITIAVINKNRREAANKPKAPARDHLQAPDLCVKKGFFFVVGHGMDSEAAATGSR